MTDIANAAHEETEIALEVELDAKPEKVMAGHCHSGLPRTVAAAGGPRRAGADRVRSRR